MNIYYVYFVYPCVCIRLSLSPNPGTSLHTHLLYISFGTFIHVDITYILVYTHRTEYTPSALATVCRLDSLRVYITETLTRHPIAFFHPLWPASIMIVTVRDRACVCVCRVYIHIYVEGRFGWNDYAALLQWRPPLMKAVIRVFKRDI